MGHADKGGKWPNGVIPYVFHTNLKAEPGPLAVVRKALKHWMEKTELRFVERKNELVYIIFKYDSSDGCSSAIGRQNEPQTISCNFLTKEWYFAVHEIGHAIGLLHEHQRPDREQFVHVDPSQENNKDRKIIKGQLLVGDYDCGSVVHYDMTDPHISKIPGGCPNWGSFTGLSAGDIATVRWIYPIAAGARAIHQGSAVARHGNALDLFVREKSNQILTAPWEYNVNGSVWQSGQRIVGGRGRSASSVTAVSRHPDRLDAFIRGTNKGIYTAAWDAGIDNGNWRRWTPIHYGKALPGTSVAAVARDPHKLDIFVIGLDRRVWTTSWNTKAVPGKWLNWQPVLDLKVARTTSVAAVARSANRIDIFARGKDGHVYAAAWKKNNAGGSWRGWWRWPS